MELTLLRANKLSQIAKRIITNDPTLHAQIFAYKSMHYLKFTKINSGKLIIILFYLKAMDFKQHRTEI